MITETIKKKEATSTVTRQVNVLEGKVLHQNMLNHFPSPLITHQGCDRKNYGPQENPMA